MTHPSCGAGALFRVSFLFLCFSFNHPVEAQQWNGPDASGDIINTNTGRVIVKSPTTNANWMFGVNPMGVGGIMIGETTSSILNTTNLSLGISSYSNGYAKIQAVQSNGSAWGTLALNASGGSVGIGTSTPGNLLEVATTNQLDGIKVSYNNTGLVRLHANSLTGGAYNGITQAGDAGIVYGVSGGNSSNFGFIIAPWSYGVSGIRLTPTGNVLIGKGTQTNSTYILDVNGTARANQLVVNTTGADYVFDPGYRLSSLAQIEAYVRKEHHLPDIAPAAQMQQEGMNLGDNQTRLLAKIEELTLYLIQQDKETQALKEKIKTLEERNRTLENLEQRIEKLEQK